jgi:hypothetical protein
MPSFTPRLNLDSAVLEALERAARDEGLPVESWLADLLSSQLRSKGYLPDLEPDGLRPSELNAGNDD